MGGRKSDKRYTDEAWTKRVDREAGRHRTRRAPAEPLVCEVCGDVYSDRRWTIPAAAKVRRKPTTLDYDTREWAPVEENGEKKSLTLKVCFWYGELRLRFAIPCSRPVFRW
jgi:hypothetical protein